MRKLNLTTFIITALLFSCSKEQIKQKAPSLNVPDQITTFSLAGQIGDTNISYFGRWDFSNAAQYLSYWGGAYARVKFTGTTAKIKVGNTSNFYAKIDNGSWTSFIGASGTINLTPTPLASGTHTVTVAQGKDYDYVFNFQGFIFDSGATTSIPSFSSNIIEWIGDSITTGYTDAQANVSDYAWVCSEALGTEHTQIAYPGICLTSGFTTNPGLDVGYFKSKSPNNPSPSDWNFGTYTAKLVVINLGTNDNNQAVPDATFQSTYTTFLANVRAKFPNAEIFVLRTFANVKTTPTVNAVNARISAGDTKVYYIDTNGWLTAGSSDFTDGLHPSVAGHIKVANQLQPILAPYLSGGITTIYLDHCDATTSWVSGNTLTINTTDKKEGTGSLQSAGNGTLEFQKHFTTAINTGATVASGSIDFWYYVSDASKFSTSNQIEIGSGGTNDANEYNWNIGTVVNGWNHIHKTFASAGTTGGTPNLSAINWFRIYHAKTASITTKVDAITVMH
jgi:lysophospholipase L1-like esterase